MKNKKFMFFENFLEAIGQLPEEERAIACYEFCKYGISGELPQNRYLAMFCLGVSASVQKYQGRGGAREGAGAPKGNKNAKKQEDIKNNQNNQNIQNNQNNQNIQIQQTETETETETKNRKEEIYKEEFEEFWKSYTPVKCNGRFVDKGSKKTAYEKYVKLLKKGENHENIIRGTREYINRCQENNQLTCGATVFLNQERWKCCNEDTVDGNSSKEYGQPRSILETYTEIARDYQQADNLY